MECAVKRFCVWFVLGAVLGLAMMGAAPISAQTNDALVRIEPKTIQVGQGQVETIFIVIENGNGIYGIDVRGEFDPNLIEVLDSDPSKEGVQMQPGDFIKPDFLVQNQVDNANGTFQYVITQVNPTPPANGGGIVLEIMARGKKQGTHAPFVIQYVELADRRGTQLAVTAQNGLVEIVAPKVPTATRRAAESTHTTTRGANVQNTARVPTRPRATAGPVPQNNAPVDSLSNVLLIGIALGGCLSAVLILGIAGALVFRCPRAKPPRGGFP